MLAEKGQWLGGGAGAEEHGRAEEGVVGEASSS